MIEDDTLPFLAKPVVEDDLREWTGLQLRTYQEEAWTEFLAKGAVGIFWAFGAGKSLFGVYGLARVKGEACCRAHGDSERAVVGEDWNSFRRTEFALIGFSYKTTWYVDWLPVRVTCVQPGTAALSTRLAMTRVGS